MGQELSQGFLLDRRVLRFHLWSKLCLSVPDCQANSLFSSSHTAITPVATSSPPHPVTALLKAALERLACSSRDGTLLAIQLSESKITGFKNRPVYFCPNMILVCLFNTGAIPLNNLRKIMQKPCSLHPKLIGNNMRQIFCSLHDFSHWTHLCSAANTKHNKATRKTATFSIFCYLHLDSALSLLSGGI